MSAETMIQLNDKEIFKKEDAHERALSQLLMEMLKDLRDADPDFDDRRLNLIPMSPNTIQKRATV